MEVLCIEKKGLMVRARFLTLLITGLLFSGFGGVVVSAASLQTFQALPSEQQTAAPAFTLPDHRGAPIRLADMRGKIVVVRFWATW
jgi:cytochrome oxidase Cu insertion factor (SCO1/SenC/PrrC family)